jgi:hypothetical protein
MVTELTTDRQIAIPLAACLALLIFAVLFLRWPEAVQQYALRTSDNRFSKFNPFLNWMKTRQYVWMLRTLGTLALSAVVVIVVALIRAAK